VVKRTFSWFGRNRRLAKDFENLAPLLGLASTCVWLFELLHLWIAHRVWPFA
jgi:hypothetical protein